MRERSSSRGSSFSSRGASRSSSPSTRWARRAGPGSSGRSRSLQALGSRGWARSSRSSRRRSCATTASSRAGAAYYVTTSAFAGTADHQRGLASRTWFRVSEHTLADRPPRDDDGARRAGCARWGQDHREGELDLGPDPPRHRRDRRRPSPDAARGWCRRRVPVHARLVHARFGLDVAGGPDAERVGHGRWLGTDPDLRRVHAAGRRRRPQRCSDRRRQQRGLPPGRDDDLRGRLCRPGGRDDPAGDPRGHALVPASVGPGSHLSGCQPYSQKCRWAPRSRFCSSWR